MADYDLNKISPALIAEAAHMGDEIANEIWENAGNYIGTAIANTIVTINPTRIVISGGVSAAGELLLKLASWVWLNGHPCKTSSAQNLLIFWNPNSKNQWSPQLSVSKKVSIIDHSAQSQVIVSHMQATHQ